MTIHLLLSLRNNKLEDKIHEKSCYILLQTSVLYIVIESFYILFHPQSGLDMIEIDFRLPPESIEFC